MCGGVLGAEGLGADRDGVEAVEVQAAASAAAAATARRRKAMATTVASSAQQASLSRLKDPAASKLSP